MPGNSYRELWRRTPGTVVFVLVAVVLAWAAFCVLVAGLSAGVALLVVVVGVAVLVATMWVARGTGQAHTGLLRLTGLPPITAPEWDRSARGHAESPVRRFLGPLTSARYWAALAHQLVVAPVITMATAIIVLVWLGLGLGGVSYVAWREPLARLDEANASDGRLFSGPVQLFGGIPVNIDPAHLPLVESLIAAAIGLLCLGTLPWVAAGCAHLNYWPARALLGRWDSDDLVRAVRAENLAREAAVRAEDRSLHRLERDLHDGPQQRLVRLQMDLSSLERRLAADDAVGAAELSREARGHAQAALDELRALSSGVAPPLLTDRGLSAALTALAGACPVPTHTDLPPGLDEAVGPEVARAVYFVVAELLTNVAKHAEATAATVTARVAGDGTLRLDVTDDGRGGAQLVEGHGLAGLADRLRGLHGDLAVDSPPDAGTRAVVTLAPARRV